MIATNKHGGALIQCFPLYQNHSAYSVIVTDLCDNIISCGRTCQHGIYQFDVPVLGEYHIRIEGGEGYSPRVSHRLVRLCPCCCRVFYFIFNKQPVVSMATFTLTDRYYEGLPIEKGELTLCPVPILFP